MRDVTESEKKKPEVKKEPDPKPADGAKPEPGAKPKDGEPKPGDKPDDPGIRARRREERRPELPLRKAPAAAAPPKPEPPPFKEEELEEAERQMISDAREAEELFGDEHKGLTSKVNRFIAENIKKTSEPDFDPESSDYQHWLEENRPTLTAAQARKIDEARITRRVRADNGKEINGLKHRLFKNNEEPRVAQLGQQIFQEVGPTVLPADVVAETRRLQKELGVAAGTKKAREDFKLEYDIAERIVGHAIEDMKEFDRMGRVDQETQMPMVEFDGKNPQHQRLMRMQRDICTEFSNSKSPDRLRDGKWFVTRDEWVQLEPSERHKFWTFSQKEIIDRAKKKLPAIVTAAIKAKSDELASFGARRERPGAKPGAGDDPARSRAPGIRPSPAPAGDAGGAGGVSAGARSVSARLSAAS